MSSIPGLCHCHCNLETNSGQPIAPQNATAPSITSSGTTVGTTATCSRGVWSGSSPITYTYQWVRGLNNIVGATSTTYVLSNDDVGAYVTCIVTATNAAGSDDATAQSIGPVMAAPSAPTNTGAPVVTPTATVVGTQLTTTNGTWIGSSPITYTYQWLRGASTNIPGATSNTYTLATADIGLSVRCRVTGTNVAGFDSVNSNSIGPVTAPPQEPVNTVAPAVTPTTATTGTLLTCSSGTWTGDATIVYTYQWYRGVSTVIVGASQTTYTLASADVGLNVWCRVKATNNVNDVTADSNQVGPVTEAAVAPENTTPPAVTPLTSLVGTELTTTTGVWSGTQPISYTYQWQLDAVNIPGATSNTYTLVLADVGENVRCRVTATNTAGNASANSNEIGPVAEPAIIDPPETIPQGVGGNGFTPLFAPDGLNAYTYAYSAQINEDVQPLTITLNQANGHELTFGSYEITNFRYRFEPQSTSANSLVLTANQASKFDSWREGMLDGGTVRVWRIVNGTMTNVRTSTITAHRASGWWNRTGFGFDDMIPIGTNSYTINFDGFNRPGATYYYSVVAIDAAGNQSNPSSTVSHVAPNPWPASPPAANNTLTKKTLTGVTSGVIQTPTGVTLTSSNDGRTVTISWNGVGGVVGYVVQGSDYPANEHNGYGIDLASHTEAIQPGDICWVYKQFREIDRPTMLTNRVWDVFAEHFYFSHRADIDGRQVWGKESATAYYEILNHDPATSIPNKGKTYMRLVVPTGSTGQIARYNHGGTDQDTDFYPVLEAGKEYRVEAWLKADSNRTATFDPDLKGTQSALVATWNVTSSWQQFVFEFTPAAEWTDAGGATGLMKLQLGPGTWDIDSVFIFEKGSTYYGATPLLTDRAATINVIRDHSKIKTGQGGYDLEQLTNLSGRGKIAFFGITLPDFLNMCVTVGANPWMQTEMYLTPEEWDGLIEYLAGTSGPWADKRIAQGRVAPWTDAFSEIYFEISNETWNPLFFPWVFSGEQYGKYQEYVMARLRASPHWNAGLESKFKFILGGWGVPFANSFTEQAVDASPNSDIITLAAYNGGWESGSGIPQAGIPASYQNTLNYTEQGAGRAIELLKTYNDGMDMGTYEAGPGYGLNGLNGESLSRFDDQSQERVMKSKTGGVATIDVYLRGMQEGFVTQNYFTLDEGYRWASHARHWRGGGTFPAYQFLELFNTHCTGMNLLGANIAYGPRVDLPAFFNDQANYEVYPAKPNADLVSFYVFQQGTKLCLWAISRKLPYDELPTDDDLYDAADDGVTTAYIRLPISAATTLKRYRMSGNYDQHNVSTNAFIIFRRLNYVNGTTGFSTGTLSGGTVSATVTDGLITGGTSGATAQIFRVNGTASSGWLDLVEISGTFVDGEDLLEDALKLGEVSGTIGGEETTFTNIADPKYADLQIVETTLTDFGSVRDFLVPGGLPPANADLYVFEGCTPVTTSAAPYVQNIALDPVSGDWPITLRWETDASAYPLDSLTYEIRRNNTPVATVSTNTYSITLDGTYTIRPIVVSGATTATFDETKMTALFDGSITAGRAVITKPTLVDPVQSTSGAVTKTSETIEGNTFDIYRFTGDGNIVLSSETTTQYLLAAGGGGGGADATGPGGGGGAGGVLTGTTLLAAGTYPITVGTGGAAGTGFVGSENGTNSTFNGFTAIGGGGGGGYDLFSHGLPGGSGGGTHQYSLAAGAGTLGQGFKGGVSDGHGAGGGGGGAGAAGGDASSGGTAGNGGNGIQSSITGTALYYGGGGAGGASFQATAASGGLGGGGGSIFDVDPAVFTGTGAAGQPNTGGGGGGAQGTAGAGGSGVVIIRIQVA